MFQYPLSRTVFTRFPCQYFSALSQAQHFYRNGNKYVKVSLSSIISHHKLYCIQIKNYSVNVQVHANNDHRCQAKSHHNLWQRWRIYFAAFDKLILLLPFINYLQDIFSNIHVQKLLWSFLCSLFSREENSPGFATYDMHGKAFKFFAQIVMAKENASLHLWECSFMR